MFANVVAVLASAFVTGALARLAVPGPDPMPAWLTLAIGLVGSVLGGGIALAAGSRDAYVLGIAGLLVSIALVVIYRRFVQRRPLTGPGALRFPQRGFGVEEYRRRLEQAGIDPDRMAPAAEPPRVGGAPAAAPAGAREHPTENPAHFLGLLEELHDAGVLEDAEYDAARMRLLERLRG